MILWRYCTGGSSPAGLHQGSHSEEQQQLLPLPPACRGPIDKSFNSRRRSGDQRPSHRFGSASKQSLAHILAEALAASRPLAGTVSPWRAARPSPCLPDPRQDAPRSPAGSRRRADGSLPPLPSGVSSVIARRLESGRFVWC